MQRYAAILKSIGEMNFFERMTFRANPEPPCGAVKRGVRNGIAYLTAATGDIQAQATVQYSQPRPPSRQRREMCSHFIESDVSRTGTPRCSICITRTVFACRISNSC